MDIAVLPRLSRYLPLLLHLVLRIGGALYPRVMHGSNWYLNTPSFPIARVLRNDTLDELYQYTGEVMRLLLAATALALMLGATTSLPAFASLPTTDPWTVNAVGADNHQKVAISFTSCYADTFRNKIYGGLPWWAQIGPAAIIGFAMGPAVAGYCTQF